MSQQYQYPQRAPSQYARQDNNYYQAPPPGYNPVNAQPRYPPGQAYYPPATGPNHQPPPVSAQAQYPPALKYLPPQAGHTYTGPSAPTPSQYPPGQVFYQPSASPGYHASPPTSPSQPLYSQNSNTPPTIRSYSAPTASVPTQYLPSPSPHLSPDINYGYTQNSNFFTPAVSTRSQQLPYTSHFVPSPSGGAIPTYPTTSRNHPSISSAPVLSYPNTSQQPLILPDLSALSLNEPAQSTMQQPQHEAICDGCGADPIRGNRWRCILCPDYDLCDACHAANVHNQHRLEVVPPKREVTSLNGSAQNITSKLPHFAVCDGCGVNPIKDIHWQCLFCPDYGLCDSCHTAKIHNQHRFEIIPPMSEVHLNTHCDGCPGPNKDRLLLGPRYRCLKHYDEDWCQRCKDAGKACGGPYEVIRQTDLGMQLERDYCLPMPREWLPHLRPAVVTYTVQKPEGSTAAWFEKTSVQLWYNKPWRDRKSNATNLVYKIDLERKEGKLGRDGKYAWTLNCFEANGSERPLYTYIERFDPKTFATTGESFTDAKGSSTTPVFRLDATRNSLTFQEPKTRTEYCWISNRPISTLNNERYDFQRNALFQRIHGRDNLVADWTWWDGHDQAENCLSIRDPHINHALVIASITMLHDHHWTIMSQERARDIKRVESTEAIARLTPLGSRAYEQAANVGGTAAPAAAVAAGPTKGSKLSAQQVLEGINTGLDVVNTVSSLAGVS